MFRAHVLIVRRAKLCVTLSGIITPIDGRPVHRLREEKKNSNISQFYGSKIIKFLIRYILICNHLASKNCFFPSYRIVIKCHKCMSLTFSLTREQIPAMTPTCIETGVTPSKENCSELYDRDGGKPRIKPKKIGDRADIRRSCLRNKG